MRKKIIFPIAGKKYKLTLLGKFSFLIFSIVISFLFSELCVRRFITVPLQKEYMIFRFNEYKEIPKHLLTSDLFWIKHTEFGGRKHPVVKSNKTFRILCIGDSVTESGAMMLEETFPYRLEKLLQRNRSAENMEVINAGCAAYSSLQGVRYLKKLKKYKPNLVVSWFGINDGVIAFFYQDKEQKMPICNEQQSKKILEYSRLYLFIKNYSMIINELRSKMPRVLPEDFYKNCEDMLKIGMVNDFEVVFIIPFFVDRKENSYRHLFPYKKALLDLSNRYKCKVLDIAPYLPKNDINKLFIDACHPTSKGNEVIAQVIYNLLFDKLI